MLQLDFEKAFDSIEWNFIWKTLEKINFGGNFINVIKLCYNKIESTVIKNGFWCGWFQLERGMRQECPLSGFVFLFAAEILGQMVRNDESINGINIEGIEFKLSQIADDARNRDLTDKVNFYDKLDKMHLIFNM